MNNSISRIIVRLLLRGVITQAGADSWRPRELVREHPTSTPFQLLHASLLHVLGVDGEPPDVLNTTFVVTQHNAPWRRCLMSRMRKIPWPGVPSIGPTLDVAGHLAGKDDSPIHHACPPTAMAIPGYLEVVPNDADEVHGANDREVPPVVIQ